MSKEMNLNELKEFVNMRQNNPKEYKDFMENLKGLMIDLTKLMEELNEG